MGKEWEWEDRREGVQGAENLDQFPRPHYQSWSSVHVLGSWSTIIQLIHLVAIVQPAHLPHHLPSCRVPLALTRHRVLLARLMMRIFSPSTTKLGTIITSNILGFTSSASVSLPSGHHHCQPDIRIFICQPSRSSCNSCQIYFLRCFLSCTPPHPHPLCTSILYTSVRLSTCPYSISADRTHTLLPALERVIFDRTLLYDHPYPLGVAYLSPAALCTITSSDHIAALHELVPDVHVLSLRF